MKQYLNQVANYMSENNLDPANHDQILEAMQEVNNRNLRLFDKVFSNNHLYRAFADKMTEEVYNQITN